MSDRDTADQLTVLARHMLRHGNADDAVVLLDSALAVLPDDTSIAALQCEAAHRVGRDEEAHDRLRGIMGRVASPQRAELELLDAKVLLALGRREEADAAYRRARPEADLFGEDVPVTETSEREDTQL